MEETRHPEPVHLGTRLIVAVALAMSTGLGQPAPSVSALKKMSFEELMEIEVTSVSKRPEKLRDAAAAIQVITGDDIRRAGASSLPEALRLASNLDVSQENAHEWVISARGFTSDVGNKLLVLMDGRTLYTPLFSGVFWDRQDYLLADLDRIEVISGPGGTLWGANAVNGVINITTKTAHETQGLYAEAGGGTQLRGFTGARYGGKLGANAAYRIYGKYFERDNEARTNGLAAPDSWQMGQGGFRIDAHGASPNRLTFQGDIYDGDEDIPTGGAAKVRGGNLLGRWTHVFADGSDLTLQSYYDRAQFSLPVPAFALAPAGRLRDRLDTYDLDFQHRFYTSQLHQWVWGLGYRRTRDVVRNAPALAFFPEVLNQDLFSGFAQDEITLVPDTLKFTLGTKVEHTHYTKFEFEPSARLQWTPSAHQMLWTAVSRAVRTPSRIDRDYSQPAPSYVLVVLKGGREFSSESVMAYELGYRAQVSPKLGASVSLFFNDYDDVRSTSMSPPDPVFNLPFPFFFENNLEGETYGLEMNASYVPFDRWRVQGGYSLLKEDIRVKPGRRDFNNALNETSDPEQQYSLRSSFDLKHGIELDASWRWVDRRRINNAGVAASVPSYSELDLRLGWHPRADLELSVIGRNLLHDRHPEFGLPGPNQIEIGRGIFGKVTWRY